MVTSYAQLLARDYKDRLDAKGLEYIRYAVEGAERMESLLNDLRDYWSVDEKKVDKLLPVDCNVVLKRALEYLQTAAEESGAVVTHDALPTVLAEEYPLMLLFQNLISNSIKYRRSGAPPRVHVSAQRNGTGWTVSVADNGMGIEAKNLEAIFIPFRRLHGREYAGTGLGLAMCQRIVERHGGRIWVEAADQGGSVFFFSLPDRQKLTAP